MSNSATEAFLWILQKFSKLRVIVGKTCEKCANVQQLSPRECLIQKESNQCGIVMRWLLKQQTNWNHSKPHKTTWNHSQRRGNHPKPSATTWKPTETLKNHLEPTPNLSKTAHNLSQTTKPSPSFIVWKLKVRKGCWKGNIAALK